MGVEINWAESHTFSLYCAQLSNLRPALLYNLMAAKSQPVWYCICRCSKVQQTARHFSQVLAFPIDQHPIHPVQIGSDVRG